MDRSTIRFYDENSGKLAALYEKADMSIAHNLLVRFLAENASILEIGCGSGRDAAFLIAKGYDVTAIEASPKMIEVALRLHLNSLIASLWPVCRCGILIACCPVSSGLSCASEPLPDVNYICAC